MEITRTSGRALIQDGDAFLVIRYSQPSGEWYTLPGGGQRNSEPITETVAREVLEETGAHVSVDALRFVRECISGPHAPGVPEGYHQVDLVFDCTLKTPPSAGASTDPNQCAVEWKTIAELRQVPFYPQALLDAIEQQQPFGYLGVI
jgi:ADP-ribose pyrophosphatase YjhB (NUDIX family)